MDPLSSLPLLSDNGQPLKSMIKARGPFHDPNVKNITFVGSLVLNTTAANLQGLTVPIHAQEQKHCNFQLFSAVLADHLGMLGDY